MCIWKKETIDGVSYFIPAESLVKYVLSLDDPDNLHSLPIHVIKSLQNCDALSFQSLNLLRGKIHSSDFNI